jgi:hypothetical protein
MGLSMEAGEGRVWEDGKNKYWLTYGFNVLDMDFDGDARYYAIEESLEHGEWPISLY